MSEKYTLVPSADMDRWNKFVERSPDGTIFSRSDYLKATGRPYALFEVLKGTELKAGVAVTLSGDRESCVLDELVIYNGLMFEADGLNEKRVGILSDRFGITEAVVAGLARRYRQVELALAPSIRDIRPFLWHRYHGDPSQKFRCDVRYTSYLDISQINSSPNELDTSTFSELGYSRRQEIRYARRDGVQAELSDDVEALVHLFYLTFKRQGLEGPNLERKLAALRSVSTAVLSQKMGQLSLSWSRDRQVVSAALFGVDRKRAYYLFGGNDPERQERYSGTIVLWDAFRKLQVAGVGVVDLEGVNSPARGWFKLSFGSELVNYFQLRLDQRAPS